MIEMIIVAYESKFGLIKNIFCLKTNSFLIDEILP